MNRPRHTMTPRWCVFLLVALTGCSGIAQTDGVLFPEPPRDRVTFWGHACYHIDVGGTGIVTDPVFEKTIFFRRRFVPAPPAESAARVRFILVSHSHPDHLSPNTIGRFPADAVVLCTPDAARRLEGSGREVVAMSPGDVREFPGGRIIAVAAHHMGTRYGVRAAADGRALGFVIEGRDATVFYSGDSNLFTGFSDVGWRYAPDVSIVNVNGHLPPREAARGARETRAPVVIAAHWGAYGYWLVGGNRRPRGEEELKRLIGKQLRVLEVGESLPLESRAAPPGVPPSPP